MLLLKARNAGGANNPESTLLPYIRHFSEKRYPFRIPSVGKSDYIEPNMNYLSLNALSLKLRAPPRAR